MVKAIIPSNRVDKALEFIMAQEEQLFLMTRKLEDLKEAVKAFKEAKLDKQLVEDEFMRFTISFRLDKYFNEVNNLIHQYDML